MKSYAEKIYEWERDCVEPSSNLYLSKNQCLHLTEQACKYLGIPAPSIRFTKMGSMPCRAIPSEWKIVIAAWGRSPVTILHEVAHLGTLEAVINGEDPHGPAFASCAIDLYDRFLNIRRTELIATAQTYEVQVNKELKSSAESKHHPRLVDFSDVEF